MLFWISLLFSFSDFVFLVRFPLTFPRILGFLQRESPCFFGVCVCSPVFFQKKGFEGQGFQVRSKLSSLDRTCQAQGLNISSDQSGFTIFNCWALRELRKKNNQLNFLWPKMACLGPPFWLQNSSPESLRGSLSRVLSQEMRHFNFLWGPKLGVLKINVEIFNL